MYNLRYSYYDYGNMLKTVIPSDYLQGNLGNFWFFTMDSNVFRVGGSTLVVALITASMAVTLRVIYYTIQLTKLRESSSLAHLVLRNKKHLYRILEFFYKTCMYPLMFLCLMSFKAWQPKMFVAQYFLGVSHALCIVLFVMYTVVTGFQVWFETIARVNKLESFFEYVWDLVAGLIIAVTIHKATYLALIVVFVARGMGYLVIRKMLLRDFLRAEYLKVLSVIGEATTIALVPTRKTVGVLAVASITVAIQLFHSCAVVFITERQAYLAKGKESDSLSESHARLELPQGV